MEERLAREEHLIWLLNALVAFVVGRDDLESGNILGGIEHIEAIAKEVKNLILGMVFRKFSISLKGFNIWTLTHWGFPR